MKTIVAWTATALLAAAGYAQAEAMSGKCSIDFKGYSTLHDFEGHVRSQPYTVEVNRGADGAEQWAAKLAVPAAQMDTQHRRRDKNMHALLRVLQFPLIEGSVAPADPVLYRGAANPPALPIALTIAGRANTLQATVKNWQENERRVQFDVEFPVSLKQFGLKPPSVMGVIRVDDRVDVVCHVVLLKD